MVAGHGAGFGGWFWVREEGDLSFLSFMLLVASWGVVFVGSTSFLKERMAGRDVACTWKDLWLGVLAAMETSRPCLDFSASAVMWRRSFSPSPWSALSLAGDAERDPPAVGPCLGIGSPPRTVQPRRLGFVHASTPSTATFNYRISTVRFDRNRCSTACTHNDIFKAYKTRLTERRTSSHPPDD